MLNLNLLSCFTILVSTVPIHSHVLPSLLSQGKATEATSQKPDAQMPAPFSPKVEEPHPGVSQQPYPHSGSKFLPPTQYYAWSPLGGSPIFIPLQLSLDRSQSANLPALSQQPLIFPPYSYFPLLSSPHRNELPKFSPYGFQTIPASSVPQTPANQPPNGQVLPAETPSGAARLGNAPQPIQQQQNPPIFYMVQQPMNAALGSLSSEELQMVGKIGQVGLYLPPLLTNPSAGAVQPVKQAAGLTNSELHGIVPTMGTSSAVVPQTVRPASSGPQPNTNGVPAGLERPMQEVTQPTFV